MRIRLGAMCSYVFGILMAVHCMGNIAFAGTLTVPEIDASSVTVGLGLLAAGLLVFRARKAR